MCAQAITFGCECGKTRCWNGEVCVLLSDYKEIFDKKLTEEQKVLDEAKEKRKAMAKGNEEKVLKKLSNVVVNDTAQQVKNGQSESQNQVADSQKAAQDKNSADGKKTIQEMAQDLKKKVEGKIPPLFLQQEEAKKQAQETVQETSDQAAKKAQQIQKETVKTNEDGKAVGIQIPGLPTISLPN